MTFVDTNVLLDLATDDPRWAPWSEAALEAAAAAGPVIINDIVCAETSVRFAWIEALDAFVDQAGLVLEPIPRAALFLAGRSFQAASVAGQLPHGCVAGLPDWCARTRARRATVDPGQGTR